MYYAIAKYYFSFSDIDYIIHWIIDLRISENILLTTAMYFKVIYNVCCNVSRILHFS